MIVLVIVRLGFLALGVIAVVPQFFWSFPQTLDTSDWYAGAAAFGPIVLTLVAIYGFRVSMSGQQRLRDELAGAST